MFVLKKKKETLSNLNIKSEKKTKRKEKRIRSKVKWGPNKSAYELESKKGGQGMGI